MSEADPHDSDPRAIYQLIRDPIHGYVQVHERLAPLIEHPLVQRLRRVSQTAMAQAVYPSMSGTRYEHILGSMHLADEAWRYLWANSVQHHVEFKRAVHDSLHDSPFSADPVTATWMRSRASFDRDFDQMISLGIQSTALLHDIGHPPYSHTLEPFFERHLATITAPIRGWIDEKWSRQGPSLQTNPFHERVGEVVIEDQLEPANPQLPWRLIKTIAFPNRGGSWEQSAHDLVSGDVDIDRLDYLLRDTYKSATEFGALDSQRLIRALELHHEEGNWNIGFGVRATSAIESFLVQRLQYYRWVIFHPTVIGLNHMLVHALERALAFEPMDTATLSGSGDLRVAALEELNYFAVPNPDQAMDSEPSGFVPADVDDSHVLEFLKRTSRRLRSSQGHPMTQGTARFQALVDAVVHGQTNWLSLWKTPTDYVNFARALLPEVSNCMTSRIDQLGDKSKGGTRAQLGGDSTLRANLERHHQNLRMSEVYPERQTDFNVGMWMQDLSRTLFVNQDAHKVSIAAREDHFCRQLGSYSPQALLTLPGASWIAAFEDLVTNQQDQFATRVYTGANYQPIEELSPMVENLKFVEQRRPQFYCFLSTLGVARAELAATLDQVMPEFVHAFALVCVQTLEGLPAST